jgi:hypothetical protein
VLCAFADGLVVEEVSVPGFPRTVQDDPRGPDQVVLLHLAADRDIALYILDGGDLQILGTPAQITARAGTSSPSCAAVADLGLDPLHVSELADWARGSAVRRRAIRAPCSMTAAGSRSRLRLRCLAVRRRRPLAPPRRDPRERLIRAVWAGDAAATRRALARGTGADCRLRDGTTPLYVAAVQGHAEIVRVLLAAGADPDRESLADTQGLPLCAAAAHDHVSCIDALLAGGADANRQEHDPIGTTSALHWAASKGYARSAERLLTGGADPLLLDSDRTTPLELARRAGHQRVVAVLQRAARS